MQKSTANWRYTYLAPANSSSTEESVEWKVGNWSACSAVCGPGVQARPVKCTQNGKPLDVEKCNIIPKPAVTRACELEQCSMYNWYSGDWSQVTGINMHTHGKSVIRRI